MKRYITSVSNGMVTIRDRLLGEVKRYSVHNQELEQAIIDKIAHYNYDIKCFGQSDEINISKDNNININYQPEFINIKKNTQIKIHKGINY